MERGEAWLWLCTQEGFYQPYIQKLIEKFGEPEAVFFADADAVRETADIPPERLCALVRGRKDWDYERQLKLLEKKRLRFVARDDADFPEKLIGIPDAPFGLFVKGELPAAGVPCAAIVGARRCTAYGREKAALLGRLLAENGIAVVSGLARGVDGAALSAAADAGGRAWGVLGCGADICYPRENIALYDRMACGAGGILSEFPPGLPPLSWHFPFRNRIISGLADCVIVVEAREKSGSLITADYAAEQGRDVLAVPGRMEDVLSRGCNRLIAQGAGILWEDGEVLRAFGRSGAGRRADGNRNLGLAKKENMVYSGVDFRDRSLEDIVGRTPLSRGEVCEALVSLQIRGLIRETTKNHYVRVQMQ